MNPLPIVDRQLATTGENLPQQAELEAWVAAVLNHFPRETRHEVTIRFVDDEEGRALNHDYRGHDKTTNVLSFPFEGPPSVVLPLLGDLVLCHPVVVHEARKQAKRLRDHYAHLVVHGMLHLLGYDHIEADEAEEMEGLERQILAQFAIADPYLPTTHGQERQDQSKGMGRNDE